MKSTTTPTLKLTQLPNGGLAMALIGNWPMREKAFDPIILDEQEVKALKDFLNEPDPAST